MVDIFEKMAPPTVGYIQQLADRYYHDGQISAHCFAKTTEGLSVLRGDPTKKPYDAADRELFRLMLRLDRCKVVIIPGKFNVQMGNMNLIDAVTKYDPVQGGELMFINRSRLVHIPPSKAMQWICEAVVLVSYIYGKTMGKEREFDELLSAIPDFTSKTKTRMIWAVQDAQLKLNDNRKFSHDRYIGDILGYLNRSKPAVTMEELTHAW